MSVVPSSNRQEGVWGSSAEQLLKEGMESLHVQHMKCSNESLCYTSIGFDGRWVEKIETTHTNPEGFPSIELSRDNSRNENECVK